MIMGTWVIGVEPLTANGAMLPKLALSRDTASVDLSPVVWIATI